MPRLPTVYDFSSLRLHPDGSRVLQSASQNQKLRYAAGAVQDSRGNWFARNAAGSGAVGKYRKANTVKEEKGKHEEPGDDVYEGEEDELFQRKGKGRQEGRRPDLRPAKRQKFLRDFDFLTPAASDGSEPIHALPSSDLLKSIHYFASSYYHERGQLFNASKEYRQRKKQERLRKLERQKKVEPDCEGSGESDEHSEQDEANRPRRGGRIKGVSEVVHRKDMYKVLDGSALMAIGMLVQEYVSRTLEVRIPDGWEEMISNAYSDEEAPTEDDESNDDNRFALPRISAQGDPEVEVTDVNSKDSAENDRESQEDENGGDTNGDESHGMKRLRSGRTVMRGRLETRRMSLRHRS